MVVAFVAALIAPAPSRLLNDLPNVRVVVFWHHPGIIDTKERMDARNQDEKVILKALKDAEISYLYEGGLGSGYYLHVRASDLPRWKKMVDGLIKYYRTWVADGKSYGLVKLP